jgi:hypothetical protein
MRHPLLVVACGASLSLSAAASEQIFRATAAAVQIHVAVLDGNKPVQGLAAADFVLRDSGMVQSILDFTTEPAPVDVTLLVDVSRSLELEDPWMHDYGGSSLTGRYLANEFVAGDVSRLLRGTPGLLQVDDTLEVFCFDDRVRPAADGTCSPSPLGSRHTALLDAMLGMAIQPVKPGRRRLVALVTDGVDTTSATPFGLRSIVLDRVESVVSVLALQKRWPMTTFTPFGGLIRSLPLPEQLTRFLWMVRDATHRTGGAVYEVPRRGDAAPYLAGAIQELRTRYLLTYRPSDRTPGWHRVEVSLAKGKRQLRYKPGYWRDDR